MAKLTVARPNRWPFPFPFTPALVCLIGVEIVLLVLLFFVPFGSGYPLPTDDGHLELHQSVQNMKYNLIRGAEPLHIFRREHVQPYRGSPGEGLQAPGDLSNVYEQDLAIQAHGKVFHSPEDGTTNHASLQKRQFSCNSPSFGLTTLDCIYLSEIGLLSQGPNPLSPYQTSSSSSGNTLEHEIWIGSEGPNLLTFINSADVPVILILWQMAPHDGQASFMNARVPAITYSLPTAGSAVQISIANNVAGGWSAIYNRTTTLSEYGQVDNTFGEFSTGAWATIDVSRLVNMQGDGMSVYVLGSGITDDGDDGGRTPDGVCVSDMSTCVYACNVGMGNSCGAEGTYSLLNCEGQPGSVQSWDSDGNPTGGCQGWSWGGAINVVLTRHGQQGVGSWGI